MVVNGNQLQLYVTNTSSGTKMPIARAQTVSLEFSNALIDVTTKQSNSWKENISGQRSFTLSADGLTTDNTAETGLVTINTLNGYALAGTQIFFDFGVGNARYQGSCFANGFSQSGGTDDAPTFSFTAEGTGELTFDPDITT